MSFYQENVTNTYQTRRRHTPKENNSRIRNDTQMTFWLKAKNLRGNEEKYLIQRQTGLKLKTYKILKATRAEWAEINL